MSIPTKRRVFKWDPASERDLFAACLVAADQPKGATLTKALEILEGSHGYRLTEKAATVRLYLSPRNTFPTGQPSELRAGSDNTSLIALMSSSLLHLLCCH